MSYILRYNSTTVHYTTKTFLIHQKMKKNEKSTRYTNVNK